jgi:hypothetical protein
MKNILFVTREPGFNCWRNFCQSIPDQPTMWIDEHIVNKELICYNGKFQYSMLWNTTIVEFKTIEDCMFFKLRFA